MADRGLQLSISSSGGRVRQEARAAKSDLAASRKDHENLLLSLQAEAD